MKKLLILCMTILLAACSGNDNDNNVVGTSAPETPAPEIVNARFELVTTNLTVAQPLSPLATIIHSDSQQMFSIGTSASTALELLAEGGDNSELLDAVEGAAEASGSSPLGPGASETLELEIEGDTLTGMQLSLLTMLVNTNDAFTGLNAVDISTLAVGESRSFHTLSYDSGTEANTEQGTDFPGPAGGGEGFSATRDDIRDQVTLHGGVVTADDGLASSDLDQSHRWDNPVARVSITRVQ